MMQFLQSHSICSIDDSHKADEMFKCFSHSLSYNKWSAGLSRYCRYGLPTSSWVILHLAAAAVPSVHQQMQVTISVGATHPLSNGHHRDLCYWMIHQIIGAKHCSSDVPIPACVAFRSWCIWNDDTHLAPGAAGPKNEIVLYTFN